MSTWGNAGRGSARAMIKTAAVMAGAAGFLFLSHAANAQDVGLNVVSNSIALSGGDPRVIIARIINTFLGLLGVIAVSLVLYGGFLWMTSGGEQEKVQRAKRVLINAVIGIVIILSSWALVTFIFNALLGGSGNGGGDGNGGGSGGGAGAFTWRKGSRALGDVIEYHYPEPMMRDVPREMTMIIRFKSPINPETVIAGTDEVRDGRITIEKKTTNGQWEAEPGAGFIAQLSSDKRELTIKRRAADALWGSADKAVTYQVTLREIANEGEAQSIFKNPDFYAWTFDTSTVATDLVLPTASLNFANDPLIRYPRNGLVQVRFSKIMDWGTFEGPGNEPNLRVEQVDADGNVVGNGAVSGFWKRANNGKTAVFIPTEECGTNSCGETIFCLPESARIRVTVDAPTVPAGVAPPRPPRTAGLAQSGVTDMVNNPLDGNKNGQVNDGDSFISYFYTSNAIEKDPPTIAKVTPDVGGIREIQALGRPIELEFSEALDESSVPGSIIVSYREPEFGYWLNVKDDQKTIEIKHQGLSDAGGAEYQPQVAYGIRDGNQNCFAPASGPAQAGSANRCTTDSANPYCCYRDDNGIGKVEKQGTKCEF